MVERKKNAYATKKTAPNFTRGLTANIWEDVTTEIGKAKGEYGRKILEEDFRSWLKIAIDLNPPPSSDLVQTNQRGPYPGQTLFGPYLPQRTTSCWT